ncbi:hypothetical protein AN958_08566, partial [Leucoagaricus sp. SymC.cos]
RSRATPEFVTAYTVSEVQSPAPWRTPQLDRPEDPRIEEIFIAPLPRRPNYAYSDPKHGRRRPRTRAPPPTPASCHDEYDEPANEYQVELEHDYDRGIPPERYWHQRRARTSESTSTCSASDCEECAYTEPRHFDDHVRTRRMPIPYVIVPEQSIGPRTPLSASPHEYTTHSGLYGREGRWVYHSHNPAEPQRSIEGRPVAREMSLVNNTSPIAGSHNQLVIFQGTTRSEELDREVASDELSMLDSNVSSPRWSMANQRYMSGSETHSDARSHSPMTSLGRSLYERPDPRFSHGHLPPREHFQRPVIITRSNEGYDSRRFGRHDDYGRSCSNESGSDEKYSDDDRSQNSSDSDEYYTNRYERRYW